MDRKLCCCNARSLSNDFLHCRGVFRAAQDHLYREKCPWNEAFLILKMIMMNSWPTSNFCPAKEVNCFHFPSLLQSLTETIRAQWQRPTSEFLTFVPSWEFQHLYLAVLSPGLCDIGCSSSPCVILLCWTGQPLFKKPWCFQRDPPGSQSLMGEIPPLCEYDHPDLNHFPLPSLQSWKHYYFSLPQLFLQELSIETLHWCCVLLEALRCSDFTDPKDVRF